jgi:hypothetical protein
MRFYCTVWLVSMLQVVGTHAVLSEPVQFAQLGLAVVDEQHRFGVAQRAKLQNKNTPAPHVLAMTVCQQWVRLDLMTAVAGPFQMHCKTCNISLPQDCYDVIGGKWLRPGPLSQFKVATTAEVQATPIPRTLSLVSYGDMALSVINELPPGRSPIATRVLLDKASPREEVQGRASPCYHLLRVSGQPATAPQPGQQHLADVPSARQLTARACTLDVLSSGLEVFAGAVPADV